MGFRLRKSFGKGPFRLNISKSGVGWSVGAKGARYTKKAVGGSRTTLSVPGTGISYVTETSKKKSKKEKNMKKNAKASVVTNENSKPKKSFYKRWWFWVIVVVCLISSCAGGKDTPPVNETPSMIIEETVDTIVDTKSSTEVPEKTLATEATEPPIAETVFPVVEETKKFETIPPIIKETASSTTEAPKILVYTTSKGEKYHTATCRWIKNKDVTEWEIEDAITAGYEQCGTCKPR